ncbi:hypothetical protein [Crinalium epipsammum]|nr:hypothetical protein [Crinalium epipsammum]
MDNSRIVDLGLTVLLVSIFLEMRLYVLDAIAQSYTYNLAANNR